MPSHRVRWVSLGLIAICLVGFALSNSRAQIASSATMQQIIVPGEDRFAPFAITVRVGQAVQWINRDTDDHTIVSNDIFNTAGHRGTNVLLPGNGGTFTLTFSHPGMFPFYCRFHAVLDGFHQPKAPGPDGGIQDPNGNFGTPMNGVITVLSQD